MCCAQVLGIRCQLEKIFLNPGAKFIHCSGAAFEDRGESGVEVQSADEREGHPRKCIVDMERPRLTMKREDRGEVQVFLLGNEVHPAGNGKDEVLTKELVELRIFRMNRLPTEPWCLGRVAPGAKESGVGKRFRDGLHVNRMKWVKIEYCRHGVTAIGELEDLLLDFTLESVAVEKNEASLGQAHQGHLSAHVDQRGHFERAANVPETVGDGKNLVCHEPRVYRVSSLGSRSEGSAEAQGRFDSASQGLSISLRPSGVR